MKNLIKTKNRLRVKFMEKKKEYIMDGLELLPQAFRFYADIVVNEPELAKNKKLVRLPSLWLSDRKNLSKNWNNIKKLTWPNKPDPSEINEQPYYAYSEFMTVNYSHLSDE